MANIVQSANGQLWRITATDLGEPGLVEIPGAIFTAPQTTFIPTYKVADALKLAQKMANGVPFTGVDTIICDMVSSAIYKFYPWRDTLAVIPDGTYPLLDGQQDYTIAQSMMRPTQFWIRRSDVSPVQHRDINVSKNISVDLRPRAVDQIGAASLQGGVFKLRLESAVRISSGVAYELGGEYQPHPTKVTDLQDPFWFADEFLEVFAQGLAYWAYRLAGDKRSGSAVKVGNGRIQYTDQLAQFINAMEEMAAEEDFGSIDGYYPSDSLGAVDGRRWFANQIFPYLY